MQFGKAMPPPPALATVQRLMLMLRTNAAPLAPVGGSTGACTAVPRECSMRSPSKLTNSVPLASDITLGAIDRKAPSIIESVGDRGSGGGRQKSMPWSECERLLRWM